MKKLIAPLILALALTATGCTRETEFGECKGLATESEKDANLKYSVSTWNVVLSVIFSETLLWPGLTAAFWLWCPTGKTVPTEKK